ncbi:hypothetical protein ABFX02_07G039400 [Erythranthe guttata]
MKTKLNNGFFFFFFLFLFCIKVQAQRSTVGYNCTPNQPPTSCETYVFYRATPPNFLDLASVGDLFSVSRPMISNPSNISSPAAPLLPDQSLLVPIKCSCNTVNATVTISYAAVNYTIESGDTFFLVSTQKYQYLTAYQSVEVVNPTFEPTRLRVGDTIQFPIFCKCPNKSQIEKKINYLITYVFQETDTLNTVASKFGSTLESIIDVNGDEIVPLQTIFVPISKLPIFTQPAVQPLSNKSTDKKGAILGLGIGLGICGVLIISICGTWFYRENSMKSRKYRDEEEQKMQKIGNGISKAEEVNLMADVSDCLDKYRVFGVGDLRNATNGFDDGCVIQGSVYRGCIDGEWYAIKKMKWNAYEELKILQKVNHGNLVRLEGFCIDPFESNCYLVYEHVENGSLHSWLHENKNNKKPEKLSWKTRLRIAIDIANGLQYIHEHTRPRVVHEDINSKNILLDSNMRAKIANFGLTKSGCNAITTQIVGAKGYICPEYIENGVVSTKMDVFSFGVVLLELVSGRAPVDDQGGLLWAEGGGVLEGTGKGGKLRGWMAEGLVGDETIMSSWESVVSVVAVAVACVNRDPTKRPSMVEIVYALSKSDDLFFDFSEDEFSPRQVIAR